MRENGFYWVKTHGFWVIAQWQDKNRMFNEGFILPGFDVVFACSDFDAIGDKIDIPEKYR